MAMLAIGGGWGRLTGMVVQALLGGVGGGGPTISLPAYTIVGAAAMLGTTVPLPVCHPSSNKCLSDCSGITLQLISLTVSACCTCCPDA